MIKLNMTATISQLEGVLDEPQIDLKSSNDRSKIILEPRAGKLALDTEELLKAIALVQKFSSDNPSGVSEVPENVEMVVEYVDREE